MPTGQNKKTTFLPAFLLLILLMGMFLFSGNASAATGINQQINFQGKVVNANGTNVTNGSYAFVFSLYTVASGGAAVWTDTETIAVTDGVFQYNLGSDAAAPLPGSVDFNTDNIYLGINFNADGEMTPRVRFTAAPYALNAKKVAGLTVTDTTGTLTIGSGKVISFSDAFATAGAFSTTLTATGTTNVTLPPTGTLATLAGIETITNKTIGSTGLTFSGAAVDITTGTNESLVVVANGSGIVDIQDSVTADSLTIDTGGITISSGALAVNSDSITSDGVLTIDANARVAIATGDFLKTSVAGVTGAAAGDIWYDSTAGKYKINEGGTTKTICNTTDAGCGAGGGISDGDKGDITVSGSGAAWNVDFTSTDGAGATSNSSGMETGTGGIGLLQGCADDQILKWNESTSVWECGSSRASYHNVLGGNYTNATATLSDVDDDTTGADDMAFPIDANEEWVYDMWVNYSSPTAADGRWQVNCPSGATGKHTYSDIEGAVAISNVSCNTLSATIATTAAADNMLINGYVSNGATSGTVQLQFRQNAASGTSTIYAGSNVRAYRVSGADLAEVYYSKDEILLPGTVVSLDTSIESGVKKSEKPYDSTAIGVISTKPGLVIGDIAGGGGTPAYVALAGRVPVRVNAENGRVHAGDYLTSSSKPGEAMRATRSGTIIGQAMEDMPDEVPSALVKVFIKNGFAFGASDPSVGVERSAVSPEPDIPSVQNEIVADVIRSAEKDGIAIEIGENGKLKIDGIDEAAVVFDAEGNVSLSGRLSVGLGSVISGLAEFKGKSVFRDLSTFIGQVIFSDEVIFDGRPMFNKDTGGFAVIAEGERSVDIIFDTEYANQPIVTATLSNDLNPLYANASDDEGILKDIEAVEKDFIDAYFDSDTRYIVTKKGAKGFTIVLNKKAPRDLQFSWIALAVRGATVSSVSASSPISSEESMTVISEKEEVLAIAEEEIPIVESIGAAEETQEAPEAMLAEGIAEESLGMAVEAAASIPETIESTAVAIEP